MTANLTPYWLPCGCYLRFVPDALVALAPNVVRQFTCEAHADVAKALEQLHKPGEWMGGSGECMTAKLGTRPGGPSPLLAFRVEARIFAKVKKVAGKKGLTVSQYCRSLIEKAIRNS